MTATSPAVSAGLISVAVRSIHAMADGDRADFDPLYHPRAVDRENQVQPPSSRVPGPAGVYSTALWLRAEQPDALLLVLPSDHMILDTAAFHAAIGAACLAAGHGLGAGGRVEHRGAGGVQLLAARPPGRSRHPFLGREIVGRPGQEPSHHRAGHGETQRVAAAHASQRSRRFARG